MAYTIRSVELRVTDPAAKDDLLGYYEVELYGLLGKMRDRYAYAHFGTFERTDDRSVLYSATVWTDRNGEIFHDYDSEFADDLRALMVGNVEHLH